MMLQLLQHPMKLNRISKGYSLRFSVGFVVIDEKSYQKHTRKLTDLPEC